MITAFLLSPSRTSNKDKGNRKAEKYPCVETLDELLGRFAKKPENQGEPTANRIRSLHSLASHTAEFGEKLFGHPSAWIFQWTTHTTSHSPKNTMVDTIHGGATSLDDERDSIVLFPALLRSDSPVKAGKQKARAVVVQPADIGSGFVSKEISILEKRKYAAVPSLDTSFKIMDLRDVEPLRGNQTKENSYGERGSPVKRQSMPPHSQYVTTFETADYRDRVEKTRPEFSRRGSLPDDYGEQSVDQPAYTYYSHDEREHPNQRRARRKKNRSQSAR